MVGFFCGTLITQLITKWTILRESTKHVHSMQLRQLGSNQSKLTFADGREGFFSYETPVAAFNPSLGYVKTSKKWSRTTSRHLSNFSKCYVEEKSQDFFYLLLDD